MTNPFALPFSVPELVALCVVSSLLVPPFCLLMLGLMRDAKADRMPVFPLVDEDDAE